jgi:hypothetical protein
MSLELDVINILSQQISESLVRVEQEARFPVKSINDSEGFMDWHADKVVQLREIRNRLEHIYSGGYL